MSLPRLVTIPISHYCEKARWALQRSRILFREDAHLQLVHWFAVRRAGGKRTAPVLVTDEGPITESRDIVRWADAHRVAGIPSLFVTQTAETRELTALEQDFDERLGPHARRWMYHHFLPEKGLLIRYGGTGTPGWQRRTLPLLMPLAAWGLRRLIDTSPEAAERSRGVVDRTFDRVAERLSDGRPFLLGERFTAADLTFAALAAAATLPARYGVPLPGPDEYPASARDQILAWRAHPAGQFALRLFETER